MIDLNYLTLNDIGFLEDKMILKPSAPKGCKRYSTIGVEVPSENIERYLAKELIAYDESLYKLRQKNRCFVGITYMMDESVILVYLKAKKDDKKVYSKRYVKSDMSFGSIGSVPFRFNFIEYIGKLVNEMKPIGIVALQEIPTVDEKLIHFRIIHSGSLDEIENKGNIVPFICHTGRRVKNGK